MIASPPPPYPLRMTPVLKQTIWGGRRLGEMLGKPIGTDSNYAESWEVVDHGDDQSVIQNGPLAGRTLADTIGEFPQWLLGRTGRSTDRFPLLLKYLDCNRVLSVQVHPDDARAARLTPPDLGKTEAWVVIAADPGSRIYAGLQSGVDRTLLARAVQAGQTEQVLHSFQPQPGDCVFIPAGTVHALGAGLVIAEIQQSSDTTYRLFDWNRVDDQGNPRPLHIEASLDVTDYDRGPIKPTRLDRSIQGFQTLVRCDKFVLRGLAAGAATIAGDDRFHIITVAEGQATLEQRDQPQSLPTGQTILLPAASEPWSVTPAEGSLVLAMSLPGSA